jgi:hypothetical protein
MKKQNEKKEFNYEEFEKEAIKGFYERENFMGDKGVFTPLLKHFLEKALSLELEQHLKQPEENKRNGISTKTVKSSAGEFDLVTPRDRNSTFIPGIVAKRQVVPDDVFMPEGTLDVWQRGSFYKTVSFTFS